MDVATLQRAMPGLSTAKAREYAPLLNRAMREFNITTPQRAHAFLAQLGHESVSLRYFEEIADGSAYEGRIDLGNTRPGDGKRFKGRGPIQLTGRNNYRTYGNLLGIDLEGNPHRAAEPKIGFMVAALFWSRMGGNGLADRDNFREITRRINGGYNGYADRVNRWARIKTLGSRVLPGMTALERRRRELAKRRKQLATEEHSGTRKFLIRRINELVYQIDRSTATTRIAKWRAELSYRRFQLKIETRPGTRKYLIRRINELKSAIRKAR